MYLHNAAESQLPLIQEKFYTRLATAFEFLERKVQEGKIRHYGMATWVSFRAKAEEKGIHVSLERALDIAKQVAGEHHHFHYVQLPVPG
jgi:aryl-alcohol dehydrogenase-like predicted oxidoreductase